MPSHENVRLSVPHDVAEYWARRKLERRDRDWT